MQPVVTTPLVCNSDVTCLCSCSAYSSPPLTSLPATTNDVTRGAYDPNPRRRADFFPHRGRVQPSPPSAAGFHHPLLGHHDARRGAVLLDRCPPSGPWPDDYWAYTTTPVTSSCEGRRRYHVTTPSPVDVSDISVTDERLTSVPSGMVAYAGLSLISLYIIAIPTLCRKAALSQGNHAMPL